MHTAHDRAAELEGRQGRGKERRQQYGTGRKEEEGGEALNFETGTPQVL